MCQRARFLLIFGLFREIVLKRFGCIPRNWQFEAVVGVLTGDTFLIAETGSGKSLVFQCLSDVLPAKSITLVIGPLNSLSRDQVTRCSDLKIKSKHILDVKSIDADVKNGSIPLLYISPEMVTSEDFKNVLRLPVYREHLRVLVIDEVDCVTWASFRPAWAAKVLLF